MTDFAVLESQKLISRKIWVMEKLWNFHIVLKIVREYEMIKLFELISKKVLTHL